MPTWNTAMALLRQGKPRSEADYASREDHNQALQEYEDALGLVYNEVRERIKAEPEGLHDFLDNWHYQGCNTADCIADEWDRQKNASERI